MRLPWYRPSPNLKELLANTSKALLAKNLERITEVFGNVTAEAIREIESDEVKREQLYQQTLSELTSLLLSRYEDWNLMKQSDVDTLIPDLVKATHWKLSIKGYVYSNEATATLARNLLTVLPALRNVLKDFVLDKTETMRKVLVEKYITFPSDSEAVIERTLRCLVTNLRHKGRLSENIFEWDKDYQLGIKGYILEVYLFEQLCLYTFIFKGEERARFLEEIKIGLAKYVRGQVTGQERDAVIKDIVQDIITAFLEEKVECIKNQKPLFVDTVLIYYFKRLEWQKKIIGKYRVKFLENNNIQFPEDATEEEKEDEFPEELIRILNHCRNKLSKNCQEIISKRLFGDYSEAISLADVAGLINRPYKTIEKQSPVCDRELQNCVIDNSNQQGFRI